MRRFVAVGLTLVVVLAMHSPRARAANSGHYKLVENWVHFPPEVTRWGMATGVDVDAHDNVYVLHRNDAMPIMVFDRRGNFDLDSSGPPIAAIWWRSSSAPWASSC